MSEIVTWAKQWPTASVDSVKLLEGQARSSVNKARRNRFYEQFGLIFNFGGTDGTAGYSLPMTVNELDTSEAVEAWKKNIKVHDAFEFMSAMVDERKRLTFDLKGAHRIVERQREVRQMAERQPLRWALDIHG